METSEQRRIDATNHERQALAASHGWGFSPDAPELLERWPFKPFTDIGDKRLAFGVVSGTMGNVSFTAFDYHRRPKVTHHQRRFSLKSDAVDTIYIGTLWVLTMPAKLPWFQILDPSDEVYERLEAVKPQTADPKVNRFYRLVDTDPQVAVQLLTPQVTAWMKQHKLHHWTTYGSELISVKHPILGRVKPEELTSRVAALGQLIAMLPQHMWQHDGAQAPPAPEPPAPQQPAPQPPAPPQPAYQPQYHQPQYPQQPHYPQPQQPQYPQQPQPNYPPQYPPQYPPPQYPPHGYPQQPYGNPGHPPPGYR